MDQSDTNPLEFKKDEQFYCAKYIFLRRLLVFHCIICWWQVVVCKVTCQAQESQTLEPHWGQRGQGGQPSPGHPPGRCPDCWRGWTLHSRRTETDENLIRTSRPQQAYRYKQPLYLNDQAEIACFTLTHQPLLPHGNDQICKIGFNN